MSFVISQVPQEPPGCLVPVAQRLDKNCPRLTLFSEAIKPHIWFSIGSRSSLRLDSQILLNRLHVLNNLIDKNCLLLSLNSFKIRCKEMFLT